MNYRMWHFRGEYIFENTIVRMQFAICDDEKSIGLILEEKIKKLLPDAVIETYLSGDELIGYPDAGKEWDGNGKDSASEG